MVSNRLAELVVSIEAKDVKGDEKYRYLKQLIMDAIACAIAGTKGPFADEVTKLYSSLGTQEQATAFGVEKKLSVSAAAVINTFLARVYTFDDVYEPGVIHSGAPIIMTCFAFAEWLGSTIDDVFSSIIAGYEVACDTSYAINPNHYSAGFHPTGTCNAIGVAAAAAKMMKLNVEQTTLALRLAADMACGFRQYQVDGSIVNSAFHGAKAAENGIEAALLAKTGFADPGESISGKFGIFNNTAGGYNKQLIFDNIGKHHRYMEVSLKPYPSCRYMHGAVDAVSRCISQNSISLDNIKRITVKTFAMAKEEGDRKVLGSVLDAQFSVHYNVAAYLLNHGLSISHFTPEAILNPAYPALAEKIYVEEDETLNSQYPEKWPYRAVIDTNDGHTYEYLSSYPPGSPENPILIEELHKKWMLLMEPVIGNKKASELIVKIADIQNLKKIEDIMKSLSNKVV